MSLKILMSDMPDDHDDDVIELADLRAPFLRGDLSARAVFQGSRCAPQGGVSSSARE